MSRTITAWVHGVPKGQPRGRAFVTGGKARIFTPGTAEAWKGDIARAFEKLIPESPIAEPVELRLTFHFPRPKRLCRKKDPGGPLPHVARPDWDNAAKAVCDALEQLGVIEDDKWIWRATVECLYHRKGGAPGASITLTTTDPETWE